VPLGAINTHPSILPAFRGTDVHRWQILAGVETSGVTIHYVDMRFDTGPILSQREFAVPHRATPQTLADLAGAVAAGVMPDVLRRIRAAEPGLAEAKAQSPDHARVSYRSKWPWESDEFLHLDWSKPAWAIERLVLASTQESYKYNGPFFRVREQKFIVRDARASDGRSPGRCGEVVSVDRMNVVVRCGELGECVALREIQPGTDEGWPRSPHRAKRMSGAEFVDVFDLGPRTILA
jgi:methionyl-tRNA formyltransferase